MLRIITFTLITYFVKIINVKDFVLKCLDCIFCKDSVAIFAIFLVAENVGDAVFRWVLVVRDIDFLIFENETLLDPLLFKGIKYSSGVLDISKPFVIENCSHLEPLLRSLVQ